MFAKENLEKIVIESWDDIKPYEGKDISDKHIVIKEKIEPIKLGTLTNCYIEGTNVICSKLINCYVENIADVYADEIEGCVFKCCYKVQCGDYDEEFVLKDSQFLNCINIISYYSRIENCKFNKIHTLYVTGVDMKGCVLSDIVCKNDCIISLEDGNISQCKFENLELLNDSYIVNGYGSPWIENCIFENIHTSRTDGELFIQEEEKGIFKKKVRYCFVDEDSCKGLDGVFTEENSYE